MGRAVFARHLEIPQLPSGNLLLSSPTLHAVTVEYTINPDLFINTLRPALETRDTQAVVSLCKQHWSCAQIASLLASENRDARKVASLALSLVGCTSCLNDIAQQLKDPDPMVNQLAEHALWSIWFRGGEPKAISLVGRGSRLIDARQFTQAIELFNRALTISPTFAEAYNQRAIAHYLTDNYAISIKDCRRAVTLMPIHFGAWSGLGHCYAQMGQIEEALRSYRKAIDINPHLQCIRETICELESIC